MHGEEVIHYTDERVQTDGGKRLFVDRQRHFQTPNETRHWFSWKPELFGSMAQIGQTVEQFRVSCGLSDELAEQAFQLRKSDAGQFDRVRGKLRDEPPSCVAFT